jgi:putative flippase GtrA
MNDNSGREVRESHYHHRGGIFAGTILLTVGILLLLSNLVPGWFNWAVFWPIILIVIGLLAIFNRRR